MDLLSITCMIGDAGFEQVHLVISSQTHNSNGSTWRFALFYLYRTTLQIYNHESLTHLLTILSVTTASIFFRGFY